MKPPLSTNRRIHTKREKDRASEWWSYQSGLSTNLLTLNWVNRCRGFCRCWLLSSTLITIHPWTHNQDYEYDRVLNWGVRRCQLRTFLKVCLVSHSHQHFIWGIALSLNHTRPFHSMLIHTLVLFNHVTLLLNILTLSSHLSFLQHKTPWSPYLTSNMNTTNWVWYVSILNPGTVPKAAAFLRT